MLVHSYHNSWQKRLFDITSALLFLVLTIPLWLVIPMLLFITDGWPVIFKQKRFGKNRQHFTLYKFRTMKKNAEEAKKELSSVNEAPFPMFKMKNDPRFTKVGKVLSFTGLDELPQLINILKGEMSMVGPRPLPVTEANKLNREWQFRYKMKPGIFSHWALAPHRYSSLESWRKLEKEQLMFGSMWGEMKLIVKTIRILAIKSFQKFIF